MSMAHLMRLCRTHASVPRSKGALTLTGSCECCFGFIAPRFLLIITNLIKMTDKEFLLKVHSDLEMLIYQMVMHFEIKGKFKKNSFGASGLAYEITNVANFAHELAILAEEGGLRE